VLGSAVGRSITAHSHGIREIRMVAHMLVGRVLDHACGSPKQGAAPRSMASSYPAAKTGRFAWAFVSDDLRRRWGVLGRLIACNISETNIGLVGLVGGFGSG
jgi:hypothetical protein